MHAASVDPEPGSNSPKENAQPRGCDFVRGFDRSHIRVFPDLCHSSVVKVQPTPKHSRCLAQKAEYGPWSPLRQTPRRQAPRSVRTPDGTKETVPDELRACRSAPNTHPKILIGGG